MQHSDVMESRVNTCLEYAKEKQPITAIFFIEMVTYFRKRIAYLEALAKEQQGYINMHKNINVNPAIGYDIGSSLDQGNQASSSDYIGHKKKFWNLL